MTREAQVFFLTWRTLLAFALAVLCASPSALASANDRGTVAQVEATELRLAGSVRSTGELLALTIDDGGNGLVNTLSMTLVAESLHAETDSREALSVAGATPGGQVKTEVKDFVEVRVTGPEAEGGHMLYVLPIPERETPMWAGSSLQAEITPVESAAVVPVLLVESEERTPPRAAGSGLLQWVSEEDGTLEVQGDFRMVLWAWDLQVEHGNGTTLLESGWEVDPVEPLPEETARVVGNSRSSQLHLDVHGGRLRVQGLNAADTRLLLTDTYADVGGAIHLREVRGEVFDGSGAREVETGDLLFKGKLTVESAGSEAGRIKLRLSGVVENAYSGTEVLSWVAPVRGGRTLAWYVLGGFVASVVAPGTVGALYFRRRSLDLLRAEAEALYSAGDFVALVDRLPPLLRGPRTYSQDAVVMQVEALSGLGRYAEAHALLDRQALWRGQGRRLTHDYLSAIVHMREGNWPAASRAIQDCLRTDPMFGAEALRNPVLASLRSDPAVLGILQKAILAGVEGYV